MDAGAKPAMSLSIASVFEGMYTAASTGGFTPPYQLPAVFALPSPASPVHTYIELGSTGTTFPVQSSKPNVTFAGSVSPN